MGIFDIRQNISFVGFLPGRERTNGGIFLEKHTADIQQKEILFFRRIFPRLKLNSEQPFSSEQ
jgi:hypothetical protein